MAKAHEQATFYAHTLAGAAPAQWEPLFDHLRRVAEGDGASLVGAADFASTFGAGELGRLLGWWHDLGKYSQAFQRYIMASAGLPLPGGEGWCEGAHSAKQGTRRPLPDAHQAEVAGRVDHSTAGAQHAARLGPTGRLLAYCIAGHHAGLPDNESGESTHTSNVKPIIARQVGNRRTVLNHDSDCAGGYL